MFELVQLGNRGGRFLFFDYSGERRSWKRAHLSGRRDVTATAETERGYLARQSVACCNLRSVCCSHSVTQEPSSASVSTLEKSDRTGVALYLRPSSLLPSASCSSSSSTCPRGSPASSYACIDLVFTFGKVTRGSQEYVANNKT